MQARLTFSGKCSEELITVFHYNAKPPSIFLLQLELEHEFQIGRLPVTFENLKQTH